MSLSALLLAVRNQLRTECGFTDVECDAHDDPQPHPTAGKRFIAVYPGECHGGPHSDLGIQEYLGINVGITLRFSGTPQDFISNEIYLKSLRGMEALSRKVVLAVHRNYDVMNGANTIIAEVLDEEVADIEGFITPLDWVWTTPVPEVKLGDWFWSDNENEIARKHGLFLNVSFANAHRPQHLATMK